MGQNEMSNILLDFVATRLNRYTIISLAIILVIATVAFFIKKKAFYPIPATKVIGPSYLFWFSTFMLNAWNLVTFIIFCIITLAWISLLVLMSSKND